MDEVVLNMAMLIAEIVIVAILVFLIDLFTYKWVRRLDKKEREKLAAKETAYLKELWAEWDKKKEEENDF